MPLILYFEEEPWIVEVKQGNRLKTLEKIYIGDGEKIQVGFLVLLERLARSSPYWKAVPTWIALPSFIRTDVIVATCQKYERESSRSEREGKAKKGKGRGGSRA